MMASILLLAIAGVMMVGEDVNPEPLQGIDEKRDPQFWGETVPGVVVGMDVDEKKVALTLDACRGDYDEDLIRFLREENIPAMLFVASPWIKDNKREFEELARDPLFDVAGHGKRHLPLSVKGESVYGKKGTESMEEVIEEVTLNARNIEEVTDERPSYFRSGTAHYDEIAVGIVNELNKEVIGFTVAADGGTTLTKEEIKNTLHTVEPGGIILAHMNHPDSGIAEGMRKGISALKEDGYRFVRLKDHESEFIHADS